MQKVPNNGEALRWLLWNRLPVSPLWPMREVPCQMLSAMDPDRVRLSEWFAYLERQRKPGEDLMETSNRLLFRYALFTAGTRHPAAGVLSIHRAKRGTLNTRMHRLCRKYAPETLGRKRNEDVRALL